MSRPPPLSEGAKLRARNLAMQWRARALLPIGSEHGFATEEMRQEQLELAALLTRKGGRPGNPDDGRELWVVDVMNATGIGRMAACRWVLAAMDAEGKEPTAAQIEAVEERRVARLSAQVRRHLESTTGPHSVLLGRTENNSDPTA